MYTVNLNYKVESLGSLQGIFSSSCQQDRLEMHGLPSNNIHFLKI